MTTRIYLMRHGETLFNVQSRIQGWSDSPLTEKGIAQAKQAGDYLREQGLTFDAYYSSTSERACDTLELVTGQTHFQRRKGLKEMNFGNFEGQPEYLHPPREHRRAVGNYYQIHGGESDQEVRQRVKSALTEIVQDHPDQSVLVVSHAGALYHFLASLGLDQSWTRFPSNCCIFVYRYENQAFTLEAFIDPLTGEEIKVETVS